MSNIPNEDSFFKENQHKLLESFFQMSSDTVLVLNEKGLVKYISDSLLTQLGLLQREQFDFDKLSNKSLKLIFETVTSNEEIVEITFEHSSKEKEETYHYTAKVNRFSSDTIILVLKDTTKIVRQKEENQLLKLIFAHAKDAILVTAAELLDEPHPRIVYANNAYSKMTGYPIDFLIGRSPRHLQGKGTSKEARKKIREALEAWQPIDIEILNYKKDKTPFWVNLSIFPVANEKGLYTRWVSIQHEITEKVNYRMKLEGQVKAKTDALILSNQKLQQFAYTAAHDLKSPLRSINMFLQLLERRASDKLDDSEKEYIHFAQDGAKTLLHLIEGVLEYSKVRSDKTKFEVLDLNEIVKEVCTYLGHLTTDKTTIGLQYLPNVKGNPTQIKQLFQNLITNALKYQDKANPRISISYKVVNEAYQFMIEDNGIGIPQEDLTEVFKLFNRVKSEYKQPGQGIGLATCKEIVEFHDGEIWIESTLGIGSKVFFTLPIN